MILITGASGTIGTHLLNLLDPSTEPIRAMTRDPDRLRLPTGIDVVPGDLARPETLPGALTGVRAIFALTAPGAQVADHDRTLIGAASDAGVEHIVKLSAINSSDAEEPQDNGIGSFHARGERALRDSGIAWTILRPSSFASNALRWAEVIRSGQPIPNLTGTAVQGVVDPRDVAAVAAAAFTSDNHDQQVYVLTGPDLISVPDQARELQDELQKPVTTVDVPLDVARDRMLAAGTDSSFVEIAIAGAQQVKDGGNAIRTDTVTEVLGRPARPFHEWVHDHRASFA